VAESDELAVASLVAAIHEDWLAERYEGLAGWLHPDVVVVPPGGAPWVEGRTAVVESYRDFNTAARIERFLASAPSVQVWGATAVAWCPVRIVYRLGEERFDESGVDLLVLSREGESWRLVWRTLLAGEGAEAG
jgi:hypothetical protein